MTGERPPTIRAARRGDVPALVDLRIQHLGEIAKQATHVRLLPDARQRTEQSLPVWLGQEGRIVLVAEAPAPEGEEGVLVGYAMGLVSTWPPVFKNQKVGEILECYVGVKYRAQGTGRGLVAKLTEILVGRGVEVLRSVVPEGLEGASGRMAAAGYQPLYLVMQRELDEF
ncbi:MAG: GNAT family N-acetyltransferase [Planctomycetota bacterium]|nr:GNAT family N-acetyltransferase [Planctomycetota bacterium]